MAKESTATTKMGKLDSHLSSLWVLAALFVAVFVTICIYVYAGKQSDLPAREFPDTTIKGNLTVDGVLNTRPVPLTNFKGLAQTVLGTGANITYVANSVMYNNYSGANAQAVALPAAIAGVIVVHLQQNDTAGGVATLTFNCAGTDVWETGSVVPSTAGGARTSDTSVAGETQLVFTPQNADTNILTTGGAIIFQCVTAGRWFVTVRESTAENSTTGTFTFAA